MTRILVLILFFTIILSSINAQNTFYKQYQFALDGDDERIEYLYTIDDTLRLITERSRSTLGINFSLIDTNGVVISNVYHDKLSFFEEAILYDEEKEEFIFDGLNRRETPVKNCIFRMDKYGNLIDISNMEYGIPDSGGLDNIFHITKTEFGYVSSGTEFVEIGFYTLLNIFDKDLNLTFSDTLPNLRHISNIAYDGEGGINAIGLVQNIDLGLIDSMLFLKINQHGKIIHQKRIPHTEYKKQLNGHYPFITDTITGESYMYDEYDYDDGPSYKPRVLKFDQWGNILWDFYNWQSSPRFTIGNLYLRENGDLIIYGKGSFADETINLGRDASKLVSIDSEGNHIWEKTFYEIYTHTDGLVRNSLSSHGLTEDGNGNIYLGVLGNLPIVEAGRYKPHLLKLSPEGCFDSNCKFVANLGDHYKPNNLVTERNEIHIYNKNNGQSYRYTFSPRNRAVWDGGKLLKSTEMSGNDKWEETGRDIRGGGFHNEGYGKYVIENYDFNVEIPDAYSDYQYRFSIGIGDELRLEHPYINDKEYLRVIDIEEITLLDGRTKKQFTLECQNLDPEGNPYPQPIWIEDIGDINDFLNTPYACSNPGSEVITCFFSDGELIWQHPDYDFCTVGTEEIMNDEFNLFPNPTQDFLKLDFDLQHYTIRDSYGKIHILGNANLKNEPINVSNLSSGAYILSGILRDGTLITKQFIKI